MLLKSKGRKIVAASFLVILITNIIFPSITYALTSGPTQPEATTFEPIDTTDMVNMQTGDFTYNVPLLDVPGPDGSYPVALSYHAGVQTNMDASWVGLGWNFNPGAINRSVNGYPDDWKSPTTTNRVYWEGGVQKTYNVGVSVGIANTPATVGFGLSFATDTYKGFGVGFDISLGAAEKIGNFGVQAGISTGVGPYGDGYAGVSFGVTNGILSQSTALYVTNTGTSASFSSQVAGLLGTSISSSGGKPSFSIGGLSASVSNSNAGKVSTKSNGFQLDIPVGYFNISLGYSKVRYWTDETALVTTIGSLYNYGTTTQGSVLPDNKAYDTYSLLESPDFKNIVDYPDPTTLQGGSYPDFDVYNVNAQGLGGNMRPYMYQGALFNQNIKNQSTPLVTYYSPLANSSPIYFKFENDFSNNFMQAEDPYPASASQANLRIVAVPFDPLPTISNGDYRGHQGNALLAGSKNVQIGATIHPRHALGYSKGDRYQTGGIEGFSIVNESGMTYHFGLPAYSFAEENYQQLIDVTTNGLSFNRVTRSTPYAYTWYLTTITGPDYVDRNNNGIADDGDWGYWVDFEYGKWSNRYNWRNPSEGFQIDQDNQFENCSMGTREVYYLNAIRTRTHVALFEKGIRYDGKSTSPSTFQKNPNPNPDYANGGVYDNNSSQSLKLSHIYILNAADENFVSTSSGLSNAYSPSTTRAYTCSDCELPSNVLDSTDVEAVGRAALEAKAIKVIDFNYDYSLCSGTANSFDIDHSTILQGKLTLQSVLTRGKQGVNLVPPLQFGYDLTGNDAQSTSSVSVSAYGYSFTTSNPNFSVGDMIMLSGSPNTYLGVITRADNSTGPWIYYMVNGKYTGAITTGTVYKTKNPPYYKDYYDFWGVFKSDYHNYGAGNDNLNRATTVASSGGVDAWSLRTITTPLGGTIKVNYGPDLLASSVLSANLPYSLNNIKLDGPVVNGNISNITFLLSYFPSTPVGLALSGGFAGNILIQTSYTSPVGTGTRNFPIFTNTYVVNSIESNGTVHATLGTPIPQVIPNNPDHSFDLTFGNFWTGNLSILTGTPPYGGGVRVKNISSVNNDGTQYITSYDISIPSTNNSSGVSSSTPSILDFYDKFALKNLDAFAQNYAGLNLKLTDGYKRALYKGANLLYSLAREMPPPGVIYQYVTVSNQIKNPDEASPRLIEGSTQYEFQVFNSNMISVTDVTGRPAAIVNSWGTMFSRNMALKKFIGAIGALKRITVFDPLGNKLTETTNHYLHDGIIDVTDGSFMAQYKPLLQKYNNQGFFQERYSEVKDVTNQVKSTDNGVKASQFAKEEYPCISTGQTIINYINGTKKTTSNLAYDFFSGAITKTIETDIYGNSFVTQNTPAYQIPQYASMGLKYGTTLNKNMLTQVAESIKWQSDGNVNNLGVVSANVTTWNNTAPQLDIDGTSNPENQYQDVWRSQSSYNWMYNQTGTNGTTPIANFIDFNFANPAASNANWTKTSSVTLYDVFSKALETSDINGNNGAIKVNYGNQKVVLQGGPAKYYEIAYSGAEDAGVNQTGSNFIQKVDGIVSTGIGVAHTGSQSLLLGAAGKKGFLYSVGTNQLTAGRNYQASVWVKPTAGTVSDVKLYYDINGVVKSNSISSGSSTKTANGWTLINMVINGSDITTGNILNVWCRNDHATLQAYVDDIRFQPINSSTRAFVYDPFSGELNYILDNSNIYTNYQYDASGNLSAIYKEKLGVGAYLVSTFQNNYSQPKFLSAGIVNQPYTKNSCGVGNTPSTVNVNVPAGSFLSWNSQNEADALATAYAQNIANSQGTCKTTITVQSELTEYVLVKVMVGTTQIFLSNFSQGTSTFSIPTGVYNIEVFLQNTTPSHNINLSTAFTSFSADVLFSNQNITGSGILIHAW